MKERLSELAARTDLTDREVAKLLGGMLGGLTEMASIEDVRRAVRWWAETDEAWELFRRVKQAANEVPKVPLA